MTCSILGLIFLFRGFFARVSSTQIYFGLLEAKHDNKSLRCSVRSPSLVLLFLLFFLFIFSFIFSFVIFCFYLFIFLPYELNSPPLIYWLVRLQSTSAASRLFSCHLINTIFSSLLNFFGWLHLSLFNYLSLLLSFISHLSIDKDYVHLHTRSTTTGLGWATSLELLQLFTLPSTFSTT